MRANSGPSTGQRPRLQLKARTAPLPSSSLPLDANKNTNDQVNTVSPSNDAHKSDHEVVAKVDKPDISVENEDGTVDTKTGKANSEDSTKQDVPPIEDEPRTSEDDTKIGRKKREPVVVNSRAAMLDEAKLASRDVSFAAKGLRFVFFYCGDSLFLRHFLRRKIIETRGVAEIAGHHQLSTSDLNHSPKKNVSETRIESADLPPFRIQGLQQLLRQISHLEGTNVDLLPLRILGLLRPLSSIAVTVEMKVFHGTTEEIGRAHV